MDVVGYPHKELGAEAYYYVMINAPMECLTLNKLQKVWWSCVKTNIQTEKSKSTFLAIWVSLSRPNNIYLTKASDSFVA